MTGFRATGRMTVPDAPGAEARPCSPASASTMPARRRRSAGIYAASGYLADPHTAIGLAAARAEPVGDGVPIIAMGTAHPAKFPDAIAGCGGLPPASAAPSRRSI